MAKQTVQVLLSPKVIQQIKTEARRQETSFSEIARRLITRGVQRGEHKKA